jgi:antirestriction protein
VSNEIDPSDDIIDSRDVIEQMADEDHPWHDELVALDKEASEYAEDWQYGVTLIRDTYFVTYAQEFAEEIGAMPDNAWPLYCIDWEYAARELQHDYTLVRFADTDYWVR